MVNTNTVVETSERCSDCLRVISDKIDIEIDPRTRIYICSVPNIDPSLTPFLDFYIIKEDVACFGDKSYPVSIHHFTKNEI